MRTAGHRRLARASVTEEAWDRIWTMGVRTVALGKSWGLPGWIERMLIRVGGWIVPRPGDSKVVRVGTDAWLVVPPGAHSARTYAYGYERPVTRLFERLVTPGMTVVDVGAFCGYYTILSSRLVGAVGHVYAFEPHPENYAYLTHNIAATGCTNVEPVNQAVAEASGSGILRLHDQSDHHWLSTSAEEGGFRVPTLRLDEFFGQRGWPPVDLIKIDVEGGEVSVLRGMPELSRRNPQLHLIVEFDGANLTRAGKTQAEMTAALDALGFTVGAVIEKGFRPYSASHPLPDRGPTYNLFFARTPRTSSDFKD